MTLRSGFVSIVGRPNAGKSTLTNRLIGHKVAITSDRPQTTRRLIRGILTTDDAQLIIVDTPGLHRPRTLLGERLKKLAPWPVDWIDPAPAIARRVIDLTGKPSLQKGPPASITFTSGRTPSPQLAKALAEYGF